MVKPAAGGNACYNDSQCGHYNPFEVVKRDCLAAFSDKK